MTRLQSNDISRIAADLNHYDRQLVERTGCSLRAIACRAGEIEEAQIMGLLPDLRVAVIPISSGEGIIGGFTDAVLSILLHMGTNAFVTQAPDVAGICEAFEKKADAAMLADDEGRSLDDEEVLDLRFNLATTVRGLGKNRLALPRLQKIVVNMGVGEGSRNEALIKAANSELTSITGQKPRITRRRTGPSVGAYDVSNWGP